MEFIAKYGYFAVFLGSLIEGESVILTAGVLAQQGYLSLWGIIVVSFMGTLLADQFLFHIGRLHGNKLLAKWPSLEAKANRALNLLHKYNTLYILSFRFIYGIRVISPVIIGMSGVSIKRFSILNVIAAAVWSVLSCIAGYALGKGGVKLWDSVKEFGAEMLWWLPAVILLIVGILLVFKKLTVTSKNDLTQK
ncbi:MAG: DedA family protein [Alphaproteobacteria bacterium]|nr:DedA family protein [Alphaproteobacteria bacterium]